MSPVRVPPMLRARLGDPASEALVDMVYQAGREWRDEVWERTMDRFERRISEENARTRVEIIRWCFGLWITQLATFALSAYLK